MVQQFGVSKKTNIIILFFYSFYFQQEHESNMTFTIFKDIYNVTKYLFLNKCLLNIERIYEKVHHSLYKNN